VYEGRSFGVFQDPVINWLSFTSGMLKGCKWSDAVGLGRLFSYHPISPITVVV
jgi:hypothetical protein